MVEHSDDAVGITALLGPTNTGKTHRALERMLEHSTGMIGLPLRLLAREVYDRLTARIGERSVALITGEEKRVPPNPRYWVCTVEAMPLDLTVDFVAIDEIQLSTHPERGHVFTSRLLHARGRKETWFLGSETIELLLLRLVPTAKIRKHPRLSKLRYIEPVTINSLPKRSAVVAFSAPRVYEIGERIRRKHGGAALVLGALSPRTRNAQVALYQSGEVDYLVATDAIGMGLNLDISHVIFADLAKFDGRESRPLEVTELAQIAGRAGRYLNDGKFGLLSPHTALSPQVIQALEQHRFPRERRLSYRNTQLDLSSVDALMASLSAPPPRQELRSILPAEDHLTLTALSQKPRILQLTRERGNTALLWEICQIPDYRQLLFELHVRLLEEIFLQLAGPVGLLDATWIDEQVSRIDQPSAEIETLMAKIAAIRTWNYIAQRKAWLPANLSLGHRARDIEDRLSDALHDALLARFVEQRRALSLPPARHNPSSKSNIKAHPFAALMQLRALSAVPDIDEPDRVGASIDELVDAEHDKFALDVAGRITFRQRLVGQLTAGVDLLHPEVKVRLLPDPGKGALARVQRRLTAFSRDCITQLLLPLRGRNHDELCPAGRGLVYQLEKGLGTVPIEHCQEQLADLTARDRQLLASMGLRFGTTHLYLRRLLTRECLLQRVALASVYFQNTTLAFEQLLDKKSITNANHSASMNLSVAMGFVAQGPVLIRVDAHDRLCNELSGCARHGEFTVPRDLAQRLECDELCIDELLVSLGYARRKSGKYAAKTGHGHARRRPGPSIRPTEPQPECCHSPVEDSASEP